MTGLSGEKPLYLGIWSLYSTRLTWLITIWTYAESTWMKAMVEATVFVPASGYDDCKLFLLMKDSLTPERIKKRSETEESIKLYYSVAN